MLSTGSWLSLIGVILSFATIIFLIRKRVNFGLALILGSVLIGIFSLLVISPVDILKAFIQATIYNFDSETFQFQTIELAVLMTIIYMLAVVMQKTGAIERLIVSLRSILSNGGTIIAIPAIYGLMPVPGGALFSAPVVQDEGNRFNMSVSKQNFFNIWFRHIWFPVYPISSTILIMADLSGIGLYALITANLTAFFLMIAIGVIIFMFTLRNYADKNKKTQSNLKHSFNGLMYLIPPILPIFFSLLTLLGISLFTAYIIGVVFSIFLLYFMMHVEKKTYLSYVKQSLTWKLAVVIIGIMFFREIFEISGVNAVIFSLLQSGNISPIILIIVFPLLLGFLTGYLLSGITLSYVLLAPFFSSISIATIGCVSVLFVSGFVGYLISPIHLCNVLSSEYLKTDTTRMYYVLIPAAIILLCLHTLFIYFVF